MTAARDLNPALIDCLSAGCTKAFKTFAEMAAHRLAAHRIPLKETYADSEEPWPEEDRACAKPAATSPTIPMAGASKRKTRRRRPDGRSSLLGGQTR